MKLNQKQLESLLKHSVYASCFTKAEKRIVVDIALSNNFKCSVNTITKMKMKKNKKSNMCKTLEKLYKNGLITIHPIGEDKVDIKLSHIKLRNYLTRDYNP